MVIKVCKIYVLKSYLYSYFCSLRIRCIYVNKKSLKDADGVEASNPDDSGITIEKVRAFLAQISKKYGYDYKEYHEDSIIRRLKINLPKTSSQCLDTFISVW